MTAEGLAWCFFEIRREYSRLPSGLKEQTTCDQIRAIRGDITSDEARFILLSATRAGPTWETTMRTIRRSDALLAIAVLGFALAAPVATFGMGSETPAPPPAPKASTTSPGTTTAKPAKKVKKDVKKQQQSEREFVAGYRVAYNMIYNDHDYARGIAKLHSLNHDDRADVANLIGYSNRKLGNYDDSKVWYEKALAADPRHARTWSYYGMWHAEQGNMLKAVEYLETVRSICGTGCKEYAELKGVIEGTRTY
jgi:tetratricopeptide (TPR) repeat protein